MTQMPPPGQPEPMSYATPSPNASAFNLPDFLAFKYMVTVPVIKFLFLIGAGVSVLFALIIMLMGLLNLGSSVGQGLGMILLGLIWLVLGPFFVRLQCELLMVIFRINETLVEIKNSLERR